MLAVGALCSVEMRTCEQLPVRVRTRAARPAHSNANANFAHGIRGDGPQA